MQEEKSSPVENTQKKEGKSETINELAHRHMMDPNHTTSDEEIRNATLDPIDQNIEIPGEELADVDNTTLIPPIPGEPGIGDDKDDEDDDKNVPDPYTILGS